MRNWEESVVDMRIGEIIREARDPDRTRIANIATALDLIKNRIREGDLPLEVPVDVVLQMIRNTGIPGFSYHDLITANEENEIIRNLIKNITPKFIKFTSDVEPDVDNPQRYQAAAANPEETVSKMAKSAMKRRQS